LGATATAALAVGLAFASSAPPGYGNGGEIADWPSSPPRWVPPFTIIPNSQVAARITPSQARQMASDLVIDLRMQTEGLQRRDPARLAIGATALWLLKLQHDIARARAGGRLDVPLYKISSVSFRLAPRPAQAWPAIMATLHGTVARAAYSGVPPRKVAVSAPQPLSTSFEIAKEDGHYRIVSDKLPPGGSRGS
jgi:hypothetical protein